MANGSTDGDFTGVRISSGGLVAVDTGEVILADAGSQAQADQVIADARTAIQILFPIEVVVQGAPDPVDPHEVADVASVSSGARHELEEAIRTRIAGALDELRRTRAAAAAQGPAATTADAKEPVDEQRYDRVLRAYGVPSYDKGGKKVQVPVVPA